MATTQEKNFMRKFVCVMNKFYAKTSYLDHSRAKWDKRDKMFKYQFQKFIYFWKCYILQKFLMIDQQFFFKRI